MSKVYFITVDENKFEQTDPPSYILGDMYWVLAENVDEAIEHLRKQIKKYYFKGKLAGKGDEGSPKRLGENIIVEQWITEAVASAPLKAEDTTAIAYVRQEAGTKFWTDWNITLEDCDA